MKHLGILVGGNKEGGRIGAKTVCTRAELFWKELQHLREALVKCKYPHWAISRVQSKYINNNLEDNINTNNLQDHSTLSISRDEGNSSIDSNNTL